MPMDVDKTFRLTLASLRAERDRINRQIGAIESVLNVDGRGSRETRKSKRGMRPAVRKAISQRMKAYWAKRKKAAGKKAG